MLHFYELLFTPYFEPYKMGHDKISILQHSNKLLQKIEDQLQTSHLTKLAAFS